MEQVCCGVPMRELVVIESGALALLICGRCRNRTWLAGGEPIGPELALKIAQMFDQPPPVR